MKDCTSAQKVALGLVLSNTFNSASIGLFHFDLIAFALPFPLFYSFHILIGMAGLYLIRGLFKAKMVSKKTRL